MKKILAASTNATALSIPAAAASIATSTTTGLYEFQNSEYKNTWATVMFAGAGVNGGKFAYRVDGAVHADNAGSRCYVWIPLAAGEGELGTLTYGSGGAALGDTGTRWADNLTDTKRSDRAAVYSPGGNEIARVMVNVTGLVGLRVQTVKQGWPQVESCDAYMQLDDKAVSALVLSRTMPQVMGATVSSSASASLTTTATQTDTATMTGTMQVTTSVTETMTGTEGS